LSKSIFSIALDVVAVGLMFIPGVGTALGLAMQIGIGTITVAQAVGLGLMLADSLLLGPKTPGALKTPPTERLYVSLDTTAPRKIVFGITAMVAEVVYL
jgi:hypothetical protein